MKIVIAPDSFKGSLPATRVARHIACGVRRVLAGVETVEVPLADGGEGTVEALVAATGGHFAKAKVQDPLGRIIRARYGFLGNADTAVIEMAAASGLPLLSDSERDPLKTSTYGTGQLILDAAQNGARKIIIGIGGSATVDGGTGMARGLGVRFLDSSGNELEDGGGILGRIARIDVSGLNAAVRGITFTVACDVTNPLTGPEGAAAVYGPQKGAGPDKVALLDKGLANLAACIRRDTGRDVEHIPGAGAAGGLGAGLVAFLGGELRCGIDIVLEAVGLAEHLDGADLVFTGEGSVDAQSSFGKATAGVAEAAKEKNVPVILLAGSLGEGAGKMLAHGASAIFSIARGPSTEKDMIRDAAVLLESAAEQALRLFLCGLAHRNGAGKENKR